MSLLAQAKIDALSPEELWATNADTPSTFSDYMRLSFGQGEEGSLRGAATQVGPDYQPPMSGGIFGEPAVQQPSGTPRLTEEQWKASKNYRPEIPYDPGMTEARAEFLKQQFDSRRWRDDVYRRYQGGLAGQAAGIAAMLAGGSLSPENFIPILGPASRAYMATRLGKVGAYTAAGAIEGAVGNLAVAPYVYQGLAAQGEDVGLEDVALDVAFGAIIGGAFGAGAGGLARARAMREAAVSGRGASVHTATDALNLAADAVERGDVPDVGRVVAPEVERTGRVVGAAVVAPDEAPAVLLQAGEIAVEREPITASEAVAVDRAVIAQQEPVQGGGPNLEGNQQLPQETQAKEGGPNVEGNQPANDAPVTLPDVRQARAPQAAPVQTAEPAWYSAMPDVAKRHYATNPTAAELSQFLPPKWAIVDSKSPAKARRIREKGETPISPAQYTEARQKALAARANPAIPQALDVRGVEYRTPDPRPLPPDPEPESVTTAAARVGKDTPELQQFAEDMGLEDSSVVDMDLNELRRSGALTEADEAALLAADEETKMAESVALSYETLSTCVLRYGT